MIRLLTFSSLYPNTRMPRHGIFVHTRLRQLLDSGRIQARVVAPVPWFPSRSPRFGQYAKYAAVPRRDCRDGIRVDYPRYPVLPKVGMTIAPWLMARALLPVLRKQIAAGDDFDIIDAHYFYPDGVAAAWLGQRLGKPVVITARGSDINLIARYPGPRKQIQRAARRAAGLITVSAALKDELLKLGAPAERIQVLRNGVDATRFAPPPDRDALRSRLGLRGATLLSVGNLLEAKGHHFIIEALPDLPDTQLLIAGDGEYEPALRARIRQLDLGDRVQLLGTLSQDGLKEYYGAADLLVLASRREGWANVLLESMACGTPVLASAVGGSPEVVAAPAAGALLDALSGDAVAAGVRKLLDTPPDRHATRQYAEGFSWQATTDGQLQLFRQIAERSGPAD